SEQATKWAALFLILGADLQVVKVKLPARVACKSMNHAQKYLAQANRQIAELAVQLARQRVIVRHALDTGQGSEMAESLLDALEGSLRIFEKHRIFLLSCNGSSSALPVSDAATGPELVRRNGPHAPVPNSHAKSTTPKTPTMRGSRPRRLRLEGPRRRIS